VTSRMPRKPKSVILSGVDDREAGGNGVEGSLSDPCSSGEHDRRKSIS